MNNIEAAAETLRDLREMIASEVALSDRRDPPTHVLTGHTPAVPWTQEEWDKRILTCIPGAAEARAYETAERIMAKFLLIAAR